MLTPLKASHSSDRQCASALLFDQVAQDISQQGYSVCLNALPADLIKLMFAHVHSMSADRFQPARVGRGDDYVKTKAMRSDEICWITDESDAGLCWIDWTARLQLALNRRLFLGLFSFESHFAHYAHGDFYKRHVDAFRGEANRVLSLVAYFNKDWQPGDGGELVLYQNDADMDGLKVTPCYGTLVVFLSEEFPHEVLTTQCDRHSVAGWFRVNSSLGHRIDPPS